MKLKVQFINAFTNTLFKGNSAAVIIIDDWLSDDVMQLIATENNLSETAFVKPIGKQKYEIRWFSPITEIDFCGHATLAASYVIFANNKSTTMITFSTKAVGELSVIEEENGYIQMSFPKRLPNKLAIIPEVLKNGLSIEPVEVLLSEQAYFVVYNSECDVKNVIQNNELLKQLAPYDVVVTAQSEQYDFISRYFWPANGGDEDPVTGSIHAGLAPYWANKLNKTELLAFQASKRGGKLKCKVENERVIISGAAVQYLEGIVTV
ncbi:phenazine biosynthesis protein PhzF [Colwellia sp. 39_35_sub15_T18]|nr:phenazine biosynthesis protein PhzF [Colwellia sp. 39_35_sub15_T18]